MEYQAIEQRLIALEQDRERNSLQHKEFYENFKSLAVSDGKRETTQNQILTALSEIKQDLSELKSKPAKRWESVTQTIIQWAILGLLAGVQLLK